ncbi:bacitracin transport ATP-binding protein BcrA [Thermoclostridium stercorarium subsp. stercorarium DSM 8532]|uniref:Bacitracin transport ATP-binding protein BcrA n=2 Tax=Thermoclostridium stercorarium TaxID=1510 RepID=L7VN50_THES1|nr:ATP-binding cassette domain-containing protein [Thermoclostridium stercorarium]AGC67906.1 bacitracin transport ATP-binding protein BcrA [Thermoclostridium stercorarium subsp. stercorarium DSM 8532]ANX00842.1 bacitracin ABC transporter ATP-binding protein [Thermoclostridium stercorarium subsp. leptospartum DSM 9219]
MGDFIIETKGLTKKYGEQYAVKNVNMHVKKNTIYGLLGRNGAGKTTVMKMLLGIVKPTSGEIRIFGKDIKNNEREILPRIGNLIERPGFYPNLTGTENLKIFAELRGIPQKDAVEKALDLVSLPYKEKKLFGEYSLGMKQRLGIALAIMHDPELLILDEPINGLDPIGIAEMRKLLRDLCDKKGKTIIISSHILSEIEMISDDIGIIDNGVLIEEASISDLKNKNRKSIGFCVSDTNRAAALLEDEFGIRNYGVSSEDKIFVYDFSCDVSTLIKAFVKNDIDVYDAHVYENSLEDYFKKITGGVGIA